MILELLMPLLIGVMVTAAIYTGLRLGLSDNFSSIRRAVAIFAAAAGLLTTFWLLGNPAFLAEYSARIVLAGLAVVLSLLALAKQVIK